MTGGGFGGSAVALVPEQASAAVTSAVTEVFADRGWTAPTIFEVAPSDGARRDS